MTKQKFEAKVKSGKKELKNLTIVKTLKKGGKKVRTVVKKNGKKIVIFVVCAVGGAVAYTATKDHHQGEDDEYDDYDSFGDDEYDSYEVESYEDEVEEEQVEEAEEETEAETEE